MEAVVVQAEQRRDHDLASVHLDDRIGVLRREDAEAAAAIDQVPVPLLAAQARGVVRQRPQLVVAGRPDDLPEAAAEQAERPLHLGNGLAHVAGDDEPVVRVRLHLLDERAVPGVCHVEVADAQQARHPVPKRTGWEALPLAGGGRNGWVEGGL